MKSKEAYIKTSAMKEACRALIEEGEESKAFYIWTLLHIGYRGYEEIVKHNEDITEEQYNNAIGLIEKYNLDITSGYML